MPGKTEKNSQVMAIRAMRDADLSRIVELENECFSDPWSRQAFSETFHEPGWASIVALEKENVIGYACFLTVDVEAHLTNIAVAPAHRRKSVAKQLLDHILLVIKRKNCKYLLLEVRPRNVGAIAFYERHGFRVLYRRPNYYHGPVEDALVMVRDLDTSEKVD